jgi:hypothetical protein
MRIRISCEQLISTLKTIRSIASVKNVAFLVEEIDFQETLVIAGVSGGSWVRIHVPDVVDEVSCRSSAIIPINQILDRLKKLSNQQGIMEFIVEDDMGYPKFCSTFLNYVGQLQKNAEPEALPDMLVPDVFKKTAPYNIRGKIHNTILDALSKTAISTMSTPKGTNLVRMTYNKSGLELICANQCHLTKYTNSKITSNSLTNLEVSINPHIFQKILKTASGESVSLTVSDNNVWAQCSQFEMFLELPKTDEDEPTVKQVQDLIDSIPEKPSASFELDTRDLESILENLISFWDKDAVTTATYKEYSNTLSLTVKSTIGYIKDDVRLLAKAKIYDPNAQYLFDPRPLINILKKINLDSFVLNCTRTTKGKIIIYIEDQASEAQVLYLFVAKMQTKLGGALKS